MDNYIFKYHQQIKDGSVVTSRWIQLVFAYLVHGIESGEFNFDQKKADKAIKWMEKHTFHTEGPLAPKPFKMADWQKAIVSAIF